MKQLTRKCYRRLDIWQSKNGATTQILTPQAHSHQSLHKEQFQLYTQSTIDIL